MVFYLKIHSKWKYNTSPKAKVPPDLDTESVAKNEYRAPEKGDAYISQWLKSIKSPVWFSLWI